MARGLFDLSSSVERGSCRRAAFALPSVRHVGQTQRQMPLRRYPFDLSNRGRSRWALIRPPQDARAIARAHGRFPDAGAGFR